MARTARLAGLLLTISATVLLSTAAVRSADVGLPARAAGTAALVPVRVLHELRDLVTTPRSDVGADTGVLNSVDRADQRTESPREPLADPLVLSALIAALLVVAVVTLPAPAAPQSSVPRAATVRGPPARSN